MLSKATKGKTKKTPKNYQKENPKEAYKSIAIGAKRNKTIGTTEGYLPKDILKVAPKVDPVKFLF